MTARASNTAARSRAGYTESFVHVVQGEFHVSTDANVVLTTILGSCVAACIRDPLAGIGGMNHFLLPFGEAKDGQGQLRYGVHAMELLINDMLRRGCRRDRLEAKLFGGGRMVQGLRDVGRQNAEFAKHFLSSESIRFVGGSLGGEGGRRVQFWPVSGRARQVGIGGEFAQVFARETTVAPAPEPDSGDVDLF